MDEDLTPHPLDDSHRVTHDYQDAPDGAVIEWPEFGPGLWRRSGDRWYPTAAGVQ